MNDWPHAPIHRLTEQGAYMVTCGTYQKIHHLHSAKRLTLFRSRLFEYAEEFEWHLQAWAILSNHYHFVASSPQNPVHHGVVANAENYPWCSAAWFTRTARPAAVKTLNSFKTDRVSVRDDFEPVSVEGSSESGVKPPHSKSISPAS